MTRPNCTCTDTRACRPCVLIATRADYAALWEVPAEEAAAVRARIGKAKQDTPKAAAKAPPALCKHIGRRVFVHGSERKWTGCNHPKRIELGIDEVVCSCKGCGPKCKGYEAS